MITHKIIKQPPVQQRVFQFPQPRNQFTITKEDLVAHLTRYPFQVGDWVVYKTASANGPLSSSKCAIVVKIEADETKVTGYNGTPKPYLFLHLTGTSEFCRAANYTYSTDPWCHWDDGLGMVMVSPEMKEKLNDDYVQNYIQKHLPKALTYVR